MPTIKFTYCNHKGEIEERHVVPDSLEFIKSPGFNYQPGWFISGLDLDRRKRRSFSLSHILVGQRNEILSLKLED